MRCRQGRCSVFCAEHNLVEYLGIGAHGVEPLRGSVNLHFLLHRYNRWLLIFNPFGISQFYLITHW